MVSVQWFRGMSGWDTLVFKSRNHKEDIGDVQ
jgi:hypothetical protein